MKCNGGRTWPWFARNAQMITCLGDDLPRYDGNFQSLINSCAFETRLEGMFGRRTQIPPA